MLGNLTSFLKNMIKSGILQTLWIGSTFTLARLASVDTLAKIKSKKAYLWDTPTNRLLTFYTLGKSPIPYLALRAFFKIYSSVFKRGLGYTPRKYFISMWGTY